MRIKSPLIIAPIAVVISIQITFKLIDAAEEGMVSATENTDHVVSIDEHERILRGEDPTDILEPTAAGGSSEAYDCKFGKIVDDTQSGSLNNTPYVAYEQGPSLVIQVSPLIPTFLIQKHNNLVSASEFKPDQGTASKLSDLFVNRDKCLPVDLYLSHIEPIKQTG